MRPQNVARGKVFRLVMVTKYGATESTEATVRRLKAVKVRAGEKSKWMGT